jgi:hypothetical protein
MSLGTRFRMKPEANSSLRTGVGAALVGLTLLGGSLGATVAQEASPEASPSAMVASWIVEFPADSIVDNDSSTVGVKLGDIVEIATGSFETRPYVILQLANNTEADMQAAVFKMPADYTIPDPWDPASFTFPATEADLPEGVTAVGATTVAPGELKGAVLIAPEPGVYILATSTGLSVPFTVTEAVDLGVPDIFATPEG